MPLVGKGLFVFIVSLIIFSANIGGLSIYSLDEAKNAECAREMLERKDFIVPTFNYQLRTDKPPLHYYFMMLSYSIFGVNEFSARFFSAVFGALTVLITFIFAYRYFGEKVAFLSFIVLISSIHLSIQFHMAVPDPYLIFMINASLFSFYVAVKEKKPVFVYLFYLFMGLGVLSKGPVAVALPLAVAFLYLTVSRNFSLEAIRFFRPVQGILITALVCIPWYLAVYIKTEGRWIYEFIFKHNIHRFSEPMEGHGGIFLITFLFVFVGMLPFSVFIVQTLKKVWNDRKDDTLKFLMVFAGTYILFFALSETKLPNYTVPAYPPLAIMIGYYLSQINRSKVQSIISSVIFYIFITVGVVIGLYIGIQNEPPISDLYYLSLWFLILSVGGVLAAVFFFKRNYQMGIISLSAFSIFMIFVFFYIAFPPVDRRNPVMQMLPLIEKNSRVRYYHSFNPAFVFYLKKEIKPVKKSELSQFLDGKERVYIITRKKYLKDFKEISNSYVLKVVKDLFENKHSALISNRKD